IPRAVQRMAGFSGKDRRVRDRVAINGEVLGRIHTTASAPIIDLSETGALIEVHCVLRPGAIHTLRLPLPDEGELTLRCRVVRSFIHGFERHEGADEAQVRYRAALSFVELSEEERAAVRRHMG